MCDCAENNHTESIDSSEVSQAEQVSDDVIKVTHEADYASKLTDLQTIADESPDEIEAQRQRGTTESTDEELRLLGMSDPIELTEFDKNAIEKLIDERREHSPAFKEKNTKVEVRRKQGYVRFYTLDNNVDVDVFRVYIYNKDYTDCSVKIKSKNKWRVFSVDSLSKCIEMIESLVLQL